MYFVAMKRIKIKRNVNLKKIVINGRKKFEFKKVVSQQLHTNT